MFARRDYDEEEDINISFLGKLQASKVEEIGMQFRDVFYSKELLYEYMEYETYDKTRQRELRAVAEVLSRADRKTSARPQVGLRWTNTVPRLGNLRTF